jgi:hypothetical protein
MKGTRALPASGDVFLDVRDEGRAMRVSWHLDGELVVFSMWRANLCIATFRLGRHEVADLVQSLVHGLADVSAPATPRQVS